MTFNSECQNFRFWGNVIVVQHAHGDSLCGTLQGLNFFLGRGRSHPCVAWLPPFNSEECIAVD